MKLVTNLILALNFVAVLQNISYGQQFSATETAEQGVEALLDTVAGAKGVFLSDRDRYFSDIEEVLDSFVDFGAERHLLVRSASIPR